MIRSRFCWLLVALPGTALVFRQLPLEGLDQVLWADAFDSKFIRWTLEWGYHAIFEIGAPLQVWHSNSYYPAELTLAYSDSILAAQLIYGPLRMIGASPGTALYLTLIGFCILGTWLTSIAIRRTGYFSWGEQLFVLFSAQFSLVMTVFFIHYQLVGMQLAPSFLLFLFLYLRDQNYGDLLGLLGSFAAGFCFSTYLGPMMATVALLIAIPFAARFLRKPPRQAVLHRLATREGRRALTISLVITALVLLPLFLAQVLPYLRANRGASPPPYDEVVQYSARPASIFTEFSTNSHFYRSWAAYEWGDWERACFPGFLLLGSTLTFVGLRGASGLRRLRPLRRQSAPAQPPGRVALHPAEPLIPTMLIVFFGAYLLSWGPYPPAVGWLKYPYYWLSQVLPGLENVRAPGRFAMLLGLPMGIFTIVLVRALSPSAAEWKHRFLLAPLFLVLVIESLPTYQLTRYRIPHRDFYEEVAHVLPLHTPLLELPIAGKNHLATINRAMDQLLGSTLHWARLVSGYGARSTPEYQHAVHLDQLLMSGQTSIESVIAFARDQSIQHVLVHTGSYSDETRNRWVRYIGSLPPVRVPLQRDGSYLLDVRVEPDTSND